MVEVHYYFPLPFPFLFNCYQHLRYTCAVNFTVSWTFVCLNSNCPFETHVLNFTILSVCLSVSLSVSVSLPPYPYFVVIQDALCRFPFWSVIIWGFCEKLPKVLVI